MDTSQIHGHHYDHGEDIQEVADRLQSDTKYQERLREAREDAAKGGKGKFKVEGHSYRVRKHSDGTHSIEEDEY